MKYIIVNKSKKNGSAGDDSACLEEYFELGWELMVTRIQVINMLIDQVIKKDDCIVTCEDRKFLYTKIFKNVIDINEVSDINAVKNKIDLVDTCFETVHSDMYDNLSKSKSKILDIDYSNLDNFNINNKYICMQIRLRDHDFKRNGDLNFQINFLNELNVKGYTVFVGGKNSEKYCKNKNSIYVDKLRDWFSLVHNKNCLAVTGPTSGFSSGSITLASVGAKLLVTDPTNISKLSIFGVHPLFLGKCVNFTNMPFKYYTYEPTVDEFIKDIYTVDNKIGFPNNL